MEFSDISLTWRIHPLQVVTYDDIIDTFRVEHRAAIPFIPTDRPNINVGLLTPAQIPENGSAWATTCSEQGTICGIDSLPCDSRKWLSIAFECLLSTQSLYETNVSSSPTQSLDS